jgi:hypothetical protein
MGMNRRVFLVAVPVLTAAGLGCSPAAEKSAGFGYRELARNSAGSGRRETIAVFMPDTTQTREVWTGIEDELGDEFNLVAVEMPGRDSSAFIAEGMRRHAPSAVVLMNNPTVAGYRDYQKRATDKTFPPALIVMTSFLEGSTVDIAGASGISYEVPLITVVTNLRKLVASSIDRVGVVARAPLSRFVNRQATLARREQIGVEVEYVSANPNASELKRAVRRLKSRASALWILNDDRLLTRTLITSAWLPALDERPWVPSIVGAASLVSAAHSFGTFAVLPDHAALGVQTASRIFDIADNDWKLPEGPLVDLPLSTTTTVDLVQARERFALREDALAQVDRILR